MDTKVSRVGQKVSRVDLKCPERERERERERYKQRKAVLNREKVGLRYQIYGRALPCVLG